MTEFEKEMMVYLTVRTLVTDYIEAKNREFNTSDRPSREDEHRAAEKMRKAAKAALEDILPQVRHSTELGKLTIMLARTI